MRHCAIGTYCKNNILRYIPEFILQTGDPSNLGKQSQEADSDNLPQGMVVEEFKREVDSDIRRGSVLSINNAKNSNGLGSQFFIVLSDKHKASLQDTSLYTKVGQIDEGLEAIEKLEHNDELNKESVNKNGKVKGKWKKMAWINDVNIKYNPFAI